MIKHIVMWKCIDTSEYPRKKSTAIIKTLLEKLPALIPEVIDFEIGIDVNRSEFAFDVVLYSSFQSKEDLRLYMEHPSHKDVANVIATMIQKRQVVDYEVS